MAITKRLLLIFVVSYLTLHCDGQSDPQDDVQMDELLGTGMDSNSVHYANDDPDGSGEDDLFIPVPDKPKLTKSRPQPDETEEVTQEVTVEHTSFKPVELSFEHKNVVSTEEQSTVNPDGSDPQLEESTAENEPLDNEENELNPDKERKISSESTGVSVTISDNDQDFNETGVAMGETTKRTHGEGLSNIAKIGIAMGCIVLFWLLLCPIVCIICRRRDKKREKRAEEYKLKNGVPLHQHPLVDEVVLTELGQNKHNNQSNGKQKLYGNDAHSAEELQRLSNQTNGCSKSNGPAVKKPFPGSAPLASEEALDTEV